MDNDNNTRSSMDLAWHEMVQDRDHWKDRALRAERLLDAATDSTEHASDSDPRTGIQYGDIA